MTTRGAPPLVGIGYRRAITDWLIDNLDRFDAFEITVDHYIYGGAAQQAVLRDIAAARPVTAHGVGLSIGTDAPLDPAYLDRVAEAVAAIAAPSYSEHLAFTKTPGYDLGNLLPLPRTEAVAEMVVAKVREVQARVPVPFHLENISYVFDWPDSTLSDVAFFDLIRRETGVGLLLDVENLYVNGRNHDLDPQAFLDALPDDVVRGIHTAGGGVVERDYLDREIFTDTHGNAVPGEALDLLDRALERQRPDTIILERDEHLDDRDQMLDDIARIREIVARHATGRGNVEPAVDRASG